MESKLGKFLAVDKVDLKWVFDHFRNYGIAGAILYAAKHAAVSPEVSPIPYLPAFTAVAFFLLSIALFALNFMQGMNALQAFNGKFLGKWFFLLGFVVWFLLMQQLLGVRLTAA